MWHCRQTKNMDKWSVDIKWFCIVNTTVVVSRRSTSGHPKYKAVADAVQQFHRLAVLITERHQLQSNASSLFDSTTQDYLSVARRSLSTCRCHQPTTSPASSSSWLFASPMGRRLDVQKQPWTLDYIGEHSDWSSTEARQNPNNKHRAPPTAAASTTSNACISLLTRFFPLRLVPWRRRVLVVGFILF